MPCTALQPTSKPGQPRVVCISVITRWCSSCIFQEAPAATFSIIRAISVIKLSYCALSSLRFDGVSNLFLSPPRAYRIASYLWLGQFAL